MRYYILFTQYIKILLNTPLSQTTRLLSLLHQHGILWKIVHQMSSIG